MSRSIRRETAQRLLDVSNACRELQDYSSGVSRASYLADRTLQHVVAHLAIVIGEAMSRAERTDPALAEIVPQLRDVVDTRNRVVHGYDSINHELLWDIVNDDIAPLKQTVDQLLAAFATEGGCPTLPERPA